MCEVVRIGRRSDELVPRRWRGEVEQVLISRGRLGRRIGRDFEGRDLVVVALLTSTVLFLADLIRHLPLPLRLDFMGVSSYGSGTQSGRLIITREPRLDVRDRDVLVVDDILDTGRTLERICGRLRSLGARSVKTCVLLDKKPRRVEPVEADYAGFEIPNVFVVGYGLDFAERYRHLPFVGVLKPEILRASV